MRLARRQFLKTLGIAACAVASADLISGPFGSARRLQAAPSLEPALQRAVSFADFWSSHVTWRTQIHRRIWYPTPIHAALLPNGKVLLIGWARRVADPIDNARRTTCVFTMAPTPLGQAVPIHKNVDAMHVPVDVPVTNPAPWFVGDDLSCAGHTLTSDGTFFSAGGSRSFGSFLDGDFNMVGLPYAMTYDGAGWTRIPAEMQGSAILGSPSRWYPTCTRLADSRILVTAGFDLVLPSLSFNLSTEIYDPATGAWHLLSAHDAAPPEIGNYDYTHAFQLPSPIDTFDVLMFGQDGVPVLMATSGSQRWNVRGSARPGTQPGEAPNEGASTALLPIRIRDGEWGYHNGSVLIAGGEHETTHEHHADIYNPIADSWSSRLDLGIRRHHPAVVLLPDGKILVIAGHNDHGNEGVRRAQYVDPARGFNLSGGMHEEDEVRGYHSIALLLPDGRVLIGGGSDDDKPFKEKSNFRYYYPPYMSAPRPQILDAPASIGYNSGFWVAWRGRQLSEVVLMGLGSMTHSIDMNQRHVQLQVPFCTAGHAYVAGPSNPQTAPPGCYMLFLLDGNRTPSIAKIVRLH